MTNISAGKQILRRQGKCFKCLKAGHLVRDCTSGRPCYNCGNNHHTSICETHGKPKTHHPVSPSVSPGSRQQGNLTSNNPFRAVARALIGGGGGGGIFIYSCYARLISFEINLKTTDFKRN